MERVNIIETNLNFTNLSKRSKTDMIVIHHTGGDMDASAEQIHGWHLGQGWAGIGYHFVIRKDGTIERGRPEWAIGSHAYGENSHTIGIHLSGDFNATKPTAAQVEKCAMLIANLCADYDIPIDREHIVGHGELMATDCPGTYLQALLNDGTITGKANFYRNDGEPLRNPEDLDADTQIATLEAICAQHGIIFSVLINWIISKVMQEMPKMRYQTIDEVPEWGKPTIEKLTAKKFLLGGDGLDLSQDMLRIFVVLDRAGVFQ